MIFNRFYYYFYQISIPKEYPNRQKKKGKLLISHRYNLLPLLHSCPGGFQRELVV